MVPTEDVLRRAAQPTVDALDLLIDASPAGIRTALVEIRDHFYDPGYTIKQLRAALGASRWIYEQFRRHIGMTPWKLVQECRMELTVRLLRDTSLYVKDVALAVGYEDFPPFQRLSRTWCRLTPAPLRRQLREARDRLRLLPESALSWIYFERAVSGDLSPSEARRLIRCLESIPER